MQIETPRAGSGDLVWQVLGWGDDSWGHLLGPGGGGWKAPFPAVTCFGGLSTALQWFSHLYLLAWGQGFIVVLVVNGTWDKVLLNEVGQLFLPCLT